MCTSRNPWGSRTRLPVQEVLPEPKRAAIRELLREPDQQPLKAFHRGCYGLLGRHALKRVTIGSTTGEKKAVRDVVQRFADQAADAGGAWRSTVTTGSMDVFVDRLPGTASVEPGLADVFEGAGGTRPPCCCRKAAGRGGAPV